jgi:hypothetical protein
MKTPDMSTTAVEARLITCAVLSAAHRGPLIRVDMSPAAVESRLEECAEMSELCLALADASRTVAPASGRT